MRERESEGAKARSTGDNGVSRPVRRAESPLGGEWRPQRGSNPHSQIDNLVSWPLDDESSWRARGRRSRRAALLGRREQRRRAACRELEDLAGFEPASSACEAQLGTSPRLRRFRLPNGEAHPPTADRVLACRWTTGPVVAGVGLAPTCMAYETRLELPPANPRWLQRQDSNLHMAAYETALEPFQARCSAGGVVGI